MEKAIVKDLTTIKIGDTLESVIKKLNMPTKITKILATTDHMLYTWQFGNKTTNIIVLNNEVLSIEYYEKKI